MYKSNLQTATYLVQDAQGGYTLEGSYSTDGSGLITSVKLDAYTTTEPKNLCGSLFSDPMRLNLSFPKGIDVPKVTTALVASYEGVVKEVGEKQLPNNSQNLK